MEHDKADSLLKFIVLEADMKKIASLTGILLVLVAGASFAAPGINLSWDHCGTAGTLDKSIDCAVTTTAQALIGSYQLVAGMNVTSTTSLLVAQVDGATMPTFWNAGTGTGNLGGQFTADQTSPDPATCKPFFPSPSGAVLDNVHSRTTTGNRIRFNVILLLDNTGVDITPADEALAFRFLINMTAPVDQAGCNTPACFVFNRCLIEDAFNGLSEDTTTPKDRNYVTWKTGGAVNCPTATPTQKKTWGAVKALYR